MIQYRIPERIVPGKRLGRSVNHDPRSLRYLVASPARTIVSVEHQRVIPVLDQGDLGSCTGNAATGALGTKPLYDALNTAQQQALSETFAREIYSDATHIDPFPGAWPTEDTGSDGVSAAKACKTRNLISGYVHATSLSAMQAALQDAPVIVGVNWYEGFDNPDSNGLVHVSGDVRGGHEFEVLGLDVDRKLFHAVNSWGQTWGQRGHFWFSFADMDRLLHEDGDCTQLLPLTVPAPTPAPVPLDAATIAKLNAWALGERPWWTQRAKAAAEAWKAANGI